MIYYSNSTLTTPHLTFIGRWSPFHNGHVAIINKKRDENPHAPVLIMVRDTNTDAYSAPVRAQYIKRWMQENHIRGTVMIVPNVEGVYWGREVGYSVGMVDVDERIKKISATAIRQRIIQRSKQWIKAVATEESSYLLSPVISRVIDRGFVIWLTGCPASGKTTIAHALEKHLKETFPHLRTQILDGDDMRTSPLAAHVGFSKRERADHIFRMAYVAKMFADHGIIVICAFVSPDRTIRTKSKRLIGKNRFMEVYVRASLTTRMQRDEKGLYKQAERGAIRNLTGFNAQYEAPLRPSVLCDTDRQSIQECVHTIMTKLLAQA